MFQSYKSMALAAQQDGKRPSPRVIPFLSVGLFTVVISFILVLASLLSLFVFKLNLGLDFKGGTLFEIQTMQEETVPLDELRMSLTPLFEGLSLQNIQSREGQSFLISFPDQTNTQDLGAASIQHYRSQIEEVIPFDFTFRRVEQVGAKISQELLQQGLLAVIFALAAIVVYIWVRFEWHFAIGALAALAQDVILSLGFFVLTGIEFSIATLAALLMIAGYSINDTVVIFDRIRSHIKKKVAVMGEELLTSSEGEGLLRQDRSQFKHLLNHALTETLTRTLFTSATTLLALICLFVWGGEALRAFSIIMIFGVLIGTYSSLFIAAPTLYLSGLTLKEVKKKEVKRKERDEGINSPFHNIEKHHRELENQTKNDLKKNKK